MFPENRLLCALPNEDYRRLSGLQQSVSLVAGAVIHDSELSSTNVYFPGTSVLSLQQTMEDGSTASAGLVGNDGLVGASLCAGGFTAPGRAVVQVAGRAQRMSLKVLQFEFARGGPFHYLLLRYTQELVTQISQTAVCNRLHSVEQRLCRWLLMCRDRMDGDELPMTHQQIASIIGDRRESVALAAGRLKSAGFIRYSRGHISIVNRIGLEACACECYALVRTTVDRLRKADRPPIARAGAAS